MPSSVPASCSRFSARRELRRLPTAGDSPFVILNSRSEGDAREAAGRFSKDGWDGAIADLPNYLYDENHAARAGDAESIRRTSRSPKAAIILAPSASSRSCAASSARGALSPSSLRRSNWRPQGVREITLIGQDTTCYGEDLGLKDGLALLLERLAQIEELRWVRFLYAYPNKITGKLLETIAAHEKICSYIDVPLQHAAPAVLKRMKRGAGADIFLRSIEKMRREIPRSHAADVVHRRLSGRDGAGLRAALRLCARRAVRLAGRLRLLRRRRRARPLNLAKRSRRARSSAGARS